MHAASVHKCSLCPRTMAQHYTHSWSEWQCLQDSDCQYNLHLNGSCIECCVTCRPDMRASSRSLVGTLEAAAMTRSLPEQEVLKYLSHGLTAAEAEGSIMTHNTSRYFALWVACTAVV